MILMKVETSSTPLPYNLLNSDSMDSKLAPSAVARLNKSGEEGGE